VYHSANSYGTALTNYGMIASMPLVTYNALFRQMEYKPVTAYTAVQPIYVNGQDINTGTYPVLNFQPEGTQFPYIYVPIAEFSKVGASVNWNEASQQLSVVTDYFTNKSQVEEYKAKLDLLEKGQSSAGTANGPSAEAQYFTYGGKMEGMNTHQIDGVLWEKSSEKQDIKFTIGKSYRGLLNFPEPITSKYRSALLMLIDDNSKPVTFRTDRI
jgi:hypothetical protein